MREPARRRAWLGGAAVAAASVLSPGPAAAQAGDLTVELPGGATMDFVRLEAGAAVVGMTAGHVATIEAILDGPFFTDDRSAPAVEVSIDAPFWLGVHEVTRAQWRALLGDGPWGATTGDDALPATHVSRADADRLVAALNAAAGDSLFRLPSDAEWEYAARAGTTTLWSFGDDLALLPQHAWFREAGPQPVGGRAANGWGLHDMHGNVEEWTTGRWTSERVYTTCRHVARGGHFDAGGGHGWIATLPFQREPKGCDGVDADLSTTGLRLLRRADTGTAVEARRWGDLKRERRGAGTGSLSARR